MASSMALKRLLSSSARSLNPLLRQSAAASNALHASDRPLDHRRRDYSSSTGGFDPFSWRRNMIIGQSSQYSTVAAGIGDLADTSKEENLKKNVLRPLSPHLPIYKPQLSSTTSILNRISGVYLTAYVLGFYLVPIKLGSVSFSYEGFYQFLFYSSKLSLLSTEIAALAFAYHAYAGVRHLLMDVSGTVFPTK
ncbi:Succinate dehydrogenase subunit 3-1-mitochondrial [Striga hermonthica]|uniref:Succinate dehydrogenase subunit 3-1-mitochondrial n=1 Tax=Striga hermonthica TaxID=68872 RepID=A0A9N7NBQ5_STRHE|nr:Succinate dehydrogenase subunit 3-1-mitochondrial [Striga hermonthica]